jgi:hypothetical protein
MPLRSIPRASRRSDLLAQFHFNVLRAWGRFPLVANIKIAFQQMRGKAICRAKGVED